MVLTVAVALMIAACNGHRVVAAKPSTTFPAVTTTTRISTPTISSIPTAPTSPSIPIIPPTRGVRPAPPPLATVAHVVSTALGRSAPNGRVTALVPTTWYGYQSELPVLADQPGWVQVRLAQRPNQATAWIPLSHVHLSTTPWHLVLSLTSAHLLIYKDGRLLYDFPAGIGSPGDPTPPGHYFLAMTVPPPTPAYGAFVLTTSAHSDAITDWEQSGDAIIGIHGPIDPYDDSLIGTTGARISHGCIRLHDNDLARLAPVLPGSPLDIVAN